MNRPNDDSKSLPIPVIIFTRGHEKVRNLAFSGTCCRKRGSHISEIQNKLV